MFSAWPQVPRDQAIGPARQAAGIQIDKPYVTLDSRCTSRVTAMQAPVGQSFMVELGFTPDRINQSKQELFSQQLNSAHHRAYRVIVVNLGRLHPEAKSSATLNVWQLQVERGIDFKPASLRRERRRQHKPDGGNTGEVAPQVNVPGNSTVITPIGRAFDVLPVGIAFEPCADRSDRGLEVLPVRQASAQCVFRAYRHGATGVALCQRCTCGQETVENVLLRVALFPGFQAR
ncbi:hypothetical protein SAMN03159371_02009 [Variovorax sp. NFACC28]|nr:hypothetical protein SAMN03159371_02009 [Variovorax sp. NFACC28]SEG43285.1 hypothetical protein SAMN03159365_02090 [Variovorax sp. NFACC29]SFC30597.1 hypothetical protein SAMN03159379_02020 [Variovorax sp. NFACC26]SFG60476.1 hypothetical protein SAMN03159447_04000 [Variovorax sp. NFACC27]